MVRLKKTLTYWHCIELDDLNKAKVNFHSKCFAYWNADDLNDTEVRIIDDQLATIQAEHIQHDEVVEP